MLTFCPLLSQTDLIAFQVFLKYHHSESLLKLLMRHDRHATALQRLVRGWQGRRQARKKREERNARAAVKIQSGR